MYIIERNGLGTRYYAGGGVQHYPNGTEYLSDVWTSDPSLATRYKEKSIAELVCFMYNQVSQRIATVKPITIRAIAEVEG